MDGSCNNKHPVLAVVGPTASGKTALGVALAEQFGGEIISADSMQIYKGLDVGTAKVTPEETRGIPHHGVDIWLMNVQRGRFHRAGRGAGTLNLQQRASAHPRGRYRALCPEFFVWCPLCC